jgi:ferredoxin
MREPTMTGWSIDRPGLDELLELIIAAGDRLVAPVRAGERVTFEPVTDIGRIERDYVNSTLPPKEYLLPRTEPVFRFSRHSGGIEVSGCTADNRPTVLFGVRPCDAAGIDRMERVFGDELQDGLFLDRRERTTIVAVACTRPAQSCFCTAVGCGPGSTPGSDLMFTEVEPDAFLVEAVTDRGRALVDRFGSLFQEADDSMARAAREATEAAEAAMARTMDLTGVGARLREAFADPHWQAIGRGCLGCGACAYSCPSCHCFDLIDDGSRSSGSRIRLWDCCAFPTFTVHASSHNPRPDQPTRYRQRVLHKLSYFPDRFGMPMCVGCGRCGVLCPVGQDLYDSAAELVTPQHAEGSAEGR